MNDSDFIITNKAGTVKYVTIIYIDSVASFHSPIWFSISQKQMVRD